MTTEPISTAYFINPSNQSMCLYVYPANAARQQLVKNVTAAMNIHATIELMDASISMRSMSYKRKLGISSSQNFLFRNEEYRLKIDMNKYILHDAISNYK
jgi:hypothetical protein